nr:hypothetical protein [uncultured Draconibacterium sp.]
MLINEHKFLVEQVFPETTSKNGKHRTKRIILNKPGYHNSFGEKVGDDDIYECTAWNKTIDELPELKHGDKVTAVINLQGRKNIDQSGNEFYNLNISIRSLKIFTS